MAEMSQIQDQATQCQPPLWQRELNVLKLLVRHKLLWSDLLPSASDPVYYHESTDAQ